MSTSIVYYSHHGNNETLAKHLSERMGCGLQPIVEVRKRTGLTILFDLAFGRLPPIQPLQKALCESDRVILISPVWGGRVAAPLRSFLRLHRQQLRDYSFITLCGYENAGQAAGLATELERRVGRAPRALAELRVSDLVPVGQRRNLRIINSYRVKDSELVAYRAAIDDFLRDAVGSTHESSTEHIQLPGQLPIARLAP